MLLILDRLRGSSPHTRGAPPPPRRPTRPFRIIPAYAGSTLACLKSSHKGRGSSPHTRGAPLGDRDCRREDGIIPAYAGSTKIAQKGKGMAADHPRIRGEHTLHPQWVTDLAGSSPHTRGAPGMAVADATAWRIIPAYAGSTVAWDVEAYWYTDHPRIRGEHPSGGRERTECIRIIPAYAGSTS